MAASWLTPASRGHLWPALAAGAAAVLLTLGVTIGASLALQRFYLERVYPGVRSGDLPLGGLSRPEVTAALQSQVDSYLAAPVVLKHGEREWRPAAVDLGIAVDRDGMVEDALAIGRSGTLLDRLRSTWRAASSTWAPSIPARATINPGRLETYLSALASEIDQPPVDAGLAARNGQIQVTNAAAGLRLDVARTAAQVRPPGELAGPKPVSLVVVSVPPALSDAQVRQAQATSEEILARPLVLRHGERFWSLSPATLGAMLQFQRVEGPDGTRLAIALDRAKVAARVRSIAAQIDQPAQDALMRVEGGRAVAFKESRDGRRLDQTAAVEAVLAQAATERRDIALTVVEVKAAVSHTEAAAISGLTVLATGQSSFRGSPPERANNIRVAATRLNGVVIPPGGVFSFLHALGPITKENGYQEGLTILGDATVPGIGGGVCQVSTTMFRAAFWTGLPVLERHQHTYRVGYYEQDGSPVGFDAAVYDPGVDLRFRNDTDGLIIIQSAVDPKAGTLAFQFFGPTTGREVKLTGPDVRNRSAPGPRLPDAPDPSLPRGVRKQAEWAAEGLDATIGRIVIGRGQNLLQDTFFSRFVPWREKWLVGTGAPQ